MVNSKDNNGIGYRESSPTRTAAKNFRPYLETRPHARHDLRELGVPDAWAADPNPQRVLRGMRIVDTQPPWTALVRSDGKVFEAFFVPFMEAIVATTRLRVIVTGMREEQQLALLFVRQDAEAMLQAEWKFEVPASRRLRYGHFLAAAKVFDKEVQRQDIHGACGSEEDSPLE